MANDNLGRGPMSRCGPPRGGIPPVGAPAWNQIKATRSITHYRTTICADPSNIDMDDIRNSLSKTKKKFKHRLLGRKHKQDGAESTLDGDSERADSTSLSPQQEPHVVTDQSYDREENRADVTVAGGRATSMDRSPQPDGAESVPAHGNDNGQEGGEADIDGGETSQRGSRLHSDVKVAVGSGHDGELEGVSPSPSTSSIPHGGKPDGM